MFIIELEWKKIKNKKMTFWTRYKHYEYTIMSFELKNVSVIFKELTTIKRISQWLCDHISK
jgi:hypothetical protein